MASSDAGVLSSSRTSANGSRPRPHLDTAYSDTCTTPSSSVAQDSPPVSPRTVFKGPPLASPTVNAETYFNSLHTLKSSSRTNSVYSLSRLSLSNQLSQLTALALPDAEPLGISIAAIPTAPAAAKVLNKGAEQIRKWLRKSSQVIKDIDAEDDAEWAAAGAKEGLGDLEEKINSFEDHITTYITAIDDLQVRKDINNVPGEQQQQMVDQMEQILLEWGNVKKSLGRVKKQIEMAMEWEELCNTVLGDISMELEALSVHVFEMEETRHQCGSTQEGADGNISMDVQELGTIMEEAPAASSVARPSRFSLPHGFSTTTPPVSPGVQHDDTRLLALFARMQPLRASLDFLPMTIASYHTKAKDVFPTACGELESKRKALERKWKQLENDAEGLRLELSEDRYVGAFRTAGRQAQKLCESVEKAIVKLQESIDAGTQHSNPPLLAKKVENYEAKKQHYGPAIKKVLAIIEKGITDRRTVNGEILRLRQETRSRWQAIEAEMKDMDVMLEDLTMSKNQQLRDSLSSIVSMDHSASGSAVDTPGSSPASSVVMGPASNSKRDFSPGMSNAGRRSSLARPNHARRFASMPLSASNSTNVPRPPLSSRTASPSPYSKSSTPTPYSHPPRPSSSIDSKPRWNSSPKVDHWDIGSRSRPSPFAQPPSGRKSSLSFRSPSNAGISHSSGHGSSGPPGRSSPAPSAASRGLLSGAKSSFGVRRASAAPSASSGSGDWVKVKQTTSPKNLPNQKSPRRNLITAPSSPTTPSAPDEAVHDSPSIRARPRPSTAMGDTSSRRVSMLPVPKSTPVQLSYTGASGRDSSLGRRFFT